MKYFFCIIFSICLFSPFLNADNSDNGWKITTTEFSADYTGVPVANGRLGILPWNSPFSVKHVMLNNVFERMGNDMVNSVVKSINPFGTEMFCNGEKVNEKNISEWSQTIDMRLAEHITEFVACNSIRVRYSYIALRNLPYSLLMNVEITALKDVNAKFINKMSIPEDYGSHECTRRTFNADGHEMDILTTSAKTVGGRYEAAASVLCICSDELSKSGDNLSDTLSFSCKKGDIRKFTIAASVCTTCDFSDPYNESIRQLVFIERESLSKIIDRHRQMWSELWKGDIEIIGDQEAQEVVRLALFNLYGSCAEGSRLSISPMGLSSDGYNGHIFWDSELWMYPPMLIMNTGIAKSMIDYRYDRLAPAIRRASAYGYRGAMFPWESDGFGEESTPVWAITGPMEHHITADIGIAAWNYWCITQDKDWLKNEGWSLLKAAAEFWTSRVTENNDGTFSIKGVVGADEYAQNVNDNAFTNAAASMVLSYATDAAKECGIRYPEIWERIANGLRILTNEDGVTMEYDGYCGQIIKQADVNLLGYPLGFISDTARLKKDLEYYEDKIDPDNGPAMSFSIFAVQYARLGNATKAEEMFRKSYRPNMRPPFGALAETPTSDNPYFVTAAGGLLQAVLNGFAGLEITGDGLRQRSATLPKSWEKLTVKGAGPDRKTYIIENQQQ